MFPVHEMEVIPISQVVVRNVNFHIHQQASRLNIRKPFPRETATSSLERLSQEIERGPLPMPRRKPASLVGKEGIRDSGLPDVAHKNTGCPVQHKFQRKKEGRVSTV